MKIPSLIQLSLYAVVGLAILTYFHDPKDFEEILSILFGMLGDIGRAIRHAGTLLLNMYNS